MGAMYFVGNDLPYLEAALSIGTFTKLLEKTIEKENNHLKHLNLFNWFKSEGYNKIKKIIVSPSKKDIKKYISDESVAFLNWDYPDESYSEILVIQELPIIDGLLTHQEKMFSIDIRESLSRKLSLEIIETDQGYKDLAGAELQISVIDDMFFSFEKKRMSKLTLFLLGIPGAGKTFVAQCVAGEKGKLLIKLDLSRMMQLERPIQKLHYFFKWLQMLHFQGQHVVGLLDEVAQALKGGNYLQNQFKGQLLTIVEDLNTASGYQIGATMLIGTDNNIREIMVDTPQFMARFEELLFINFPREEEAKLQLKLYLDKFGVKYTREHLFDKCDVDSLYTEIKEYYHHEKIEYDEDAKRFIYSPREIKKFAARLATIGERFFEENENEGFLPHNKIIECCKRVPPQQKMLKLGLSQMINDASVGFVEN